MEAKDEATKTQTTDTRQRKTLWFPLFTFLSQIRPQEAVVLENVDLQFRVWNWDF
jgi:site-specific DNA-cytosine methylase